MSEQFHVLGEAQSWEQHPEQVFVCAHADEPRKGITIAVTDSSALARWLVGACNALITQVPTTTPRPGGHILQRGYFELLPEDGPDEFGWFYCVAWSTSGRSGVSVGRSKDRALVQVVTDRLLALLQN